MPKTPSANWTMESTANELIEQYPALIHFFDELGIDDCCLELDLRTIASHKGLAEEKIREMIEQACKTV